ncbi:MAG: hypothetical protein IPM21_17580 [Acidobacteria bacterium]|nr:hypothetical protein [Acidobacteriota bacterium]
MRTLGTFLVTAALLFGVNSAFGQPYKKIRFAKGRTSATVAGTLTAGGRVCYFANARRGQTLTATISSRTGKVNIFESGETSYTLEVEYPGDQSICVDNLNRATSYSLTVSIL